jgi:hypothetical protein
MKDDFFATSQELSEDVSRNALLYAMLAIIEKAFT